MEFYKERLVVWFGGVVGNVVFRVRDTVPSTIFRVCVRARCGSACADDATRTASGHALHRQALHASSSAAGVRLLGNVASLFFDKKTISKSRPHRACDAHGLAVGVVGQLLLVHALLLELGQRLVPESRVSVHASL